MAGGAQKDDDDIISDINVTPLVDVVLVLLIILMVTATAIANNAIDMELPSSSTANTAERTEPEILNISVNARGDIFLDDATQTPITVATLQQRATAAVRRSDKARAIIAADRTVPYGRVIEVMDALRHANLGKISFKADRAATPAATGN
jgi:biopolymer transport protein ExbD